MLSLRDNIREKSRVKSAAEFDYFQEENVKNLGWVEFWFMSF